MPDLSTTAGEIKAAAQLLAGGHGPFAVDAERASGFRYSNRAYLIQIRRAGAGTVLIDPVSHGGDPLTVLRPVAEVLAEDEWILHAADQDLPCLAEVGMRPPALYDTELAGRLAGFDRVNLAAMAQRLLGVGLAKGHGAADWSRRPLPAAWLNYAALDVEVLIDLRESIAGGTRRAGQNRLGRRRIRLSSDAVPAKPRRRPAETAGAAPPAFTGCATSVVWPPCANCGRCETKSPNAATSPRGASCPTPRSSTPPPPTRRPLTIWSPCRSSAAKRQRRSAATWLAALKAARESPGPGDETEPPNGPPPPARWARRRPEAAARLDAARAALRELSEQVTVPSENLVTPDLVRRLCWDWEAADDTAAGGRQVSGGWSSTKLAARVSGARAGRGVATAAERQRRRQSSCSVIAASRFDTAGAGTVAGQRGNPAGDAAGHVLVGQTGGGEYLATRRVIEELLRQADIAAWHVDLGGPQRG